MNKKFNKSIAIILVFTLMIGLFVPSKQAAHADEIKQDIAPSTLTSNVNVKASSENSTRKSTFANDHSGQNYWQIGGKAADIFPIEGETSSLWIAIDLGSEKTFDEVSFDIPTGFSSVNSRISQYEFVYSSDASTWANLPALSNTSRSNYDWSQDSWSLAATVTVPSSVEPGDPNWGSHTPSNGGWTSTSTGTLETPISAQYVMINYTLKSGNPVLMGMSNLKILTTSDVPIEEEEEEEEELPLKFADTYLNDPGSGYAIIKPEYTENKINSNNANVANVNPSSWVNEAYPAVQLDDSGKMIYFPDYKGNQIMDYSAVGYKGGGVEIPNVPVRERVAPLEDNTEDVWQKIQDAIDYVSSHPIQPDGFRGAVYLEPGVFRISKPLYVTTSGVVIRGAGPGTVTPIVGEGTVTNPYDQQIASEEEEPGVTKLIATWKLTEAQYTPPANHTSLTGPYSKDDRSTLINFVGDSLSSPTDISTTVTDQYVGAGQYEVHVASTSGLSVGDRVFIQKAVNANWVKAMYMDKVDGASNWLPNGNLESGFAGTPFTAERTIKSIDHSTNLLIFEEPLADSLDMRWGVSKVVKAPEENRISHVGVENIQAISHFYNTNKPSLARHGVNFLSYNDENHAQVFVAMTNVRDGWMRNFTTYQIDTAFVTGGNSRNITVQDGNVLDPVSAMHAGERRYSIYYKKSEFMFTQRVHARYMRHAYIVDSYTSGPNVFFDSTSEATSNGSEPHCRWSSGGLFDNVTSRIYLQNRWDMGTSHGWSGVNYLLYNTTGPFIATQPQIAPTYLIGHAFDGSNNLLGADTDKTDQLTGRREVYKLNSANMASEGLNGGMVPNFAGYEYSVTEKVTPENDNMPNSLYVQQLVDRLGPEAALNLAVNTIPPIDDQSSTERPKLLDLKLDGHTPSNFSPDTNRYNHTLPYDYYDIPVVTAEAGEGITVDIVYPEDLNKENISIILTDANNGRNFYSLKVDWEEILPIVVASDQQVDASNSNYAVNVLNPGVY